MILKGRFETTAHDAAAVFFNFRLTAASEPAGIISRALITAFLLQGGHGRCRIDNDNVRDLCFLGSSEEKYAQGFRAMQEIKPNQRWHMGLDEGQVINAFGARIVIRPNGTNVDEEITEDGFPQAI